jgi:hypothetical protein
VFAGLGFVGSGESCDCVADGSWVLGKYYVTSVWESRPRAVPRVSGVVRGAVYSTFVNTFVTKLAILVSIRTSEGRFDGFYNSGVAAGGSTFKQRKKPDGIWTG